MWKAIDTSTTTFCVPSNLVILFNYHENFNLDSEFIDGKGKKLQKIIMGTSNLTCSVIGCKRNWSTFDEVHTKRRNQLKQQKLNALVFIKCLSDIESNDK
ncbi:hypothetical protein CR513_11576, partial [Mucuna pruriens]